MPSGRERDRRVEQGDGDAGQLDPLVSGVLLLTSVSIVVAAHHVKAVAERLAIALLERRELLVGAVAREVALDDHRSEVGGRQFGDGRTVHRLRERRRARRRTLDGTVGPVVDATSLLLTEMDVVDRGEARPQHAARAHESPERHAAMLVLGVRRQPVELIDVDALVERCRIVGDGRQLERHDGGSLRSMGADAAVESAGSTTGH